ncbi:MAG: response regulator [Bacteroidota bacterium]
MRLYPFIIFYLVIFPAFAQEKHWQELTIADGLSQGMIYDLKQDSHGFMWVATRDGLNRYDGHNFKIFTHDPYNDFSISGNTCTALLIDSKERLWVVTEAEGLNLYDNKTQRFYKINVKVKSKVGNVNMTSIDEDPEGNIWVGTYQGEVFKIALNNSLQNGFPTQADFTDLVEVSHVFLSSCHNIITSCTFDATGNVYICDTDDIFVINGKNANNTPTRLHNISAKTPYFYFHEKDNKGRFWITQNPLTIVCWKDKTLKTIKILGNKRGDLRIKLIATGKFLIASGDYFWMMTPDELFRQENLSAQNALIPMPENYSLATTFLEDHNGNIWLGTNGYGLRKFNPHTKQFRAYLPTISLLNLYQDRQERIYILENSNYYLFDRLTNTQKKITDNVNLWNPNFQSATTRYTSFDLIQDKNDNFWVATTEISKEKIRYCLLKYNKDWQLLKIYPLPKLMEFMISGTKMVEDFTGKIWVTGYNSKFLCFNPADGKSQVFDYAFLDKNNPSLKESTVIYKDYAGTFWIGTKAGLIKVVNCQIKPHFSLFSNSKTNRQSLSNNYVSSMIDDPYQPQHYLWVTTKGGGLERMDKLKGTFEHFTEAEGLSNKVVYGILEDGHKKLWMSTNRGLSQFNPKTFIFKNYTKADGLQDDEFNTNSYFKGPSGEMLFGGLNGLNIFRDTDIKSNNTKPIVKIVGLKINNKDVVANDENGILSTAIEHSKAITLAHDQNQISFELAVMDLTNPAQNRYRYQLEGIDDEWVENGTNRFVNFSQVPSGDYDLQISGSTNGEIWSIPVVLQIRISPPFYRTWWAYLFYFGILCMIGYWWYRSQTQRLLLQQKLVFEQKETERLEELDGLKTHFFANISHEFRTPLTLILGSAERLSNLENADVSMIQRNGQRLLGLINQLLDLSKLEAKQLKPEIQHEDLGKFLRTTTAAFGSLAESRKINFQLDLFADVYMAYFDADKLEKILTNLLANAFKFTDNGGSVKFESRINFDSVLQIIISDTGIGIASTQLPHIFNRFYQANSQTKRPYEGTGIGLSLVKELVETLKGSIEVESNLGKGTLFSLQLPIDKWTWKDFLVEKNQKEIIDKQPLAYIQDLPVSLQPSNEIIQQSISENLLLLVDDNADIRAFLRSIFEEEYQIIEAKDGMEGLEKAREFTPDLIISDLMMPRMDGFEFCQLLKKDEKTSHIPVIMLSAKATLKDRIEGLKFGADEYLSKPFNQQEIKVRVQNLIQQRERLRQFYGQRVVELKAESTSNFTLEDTFLLKAKVVVEQNLNNSKFNVEKFSEEMNLSPSQLRRKLKALTNQNSVEFIREIRLQKAFELLLERTMMVNEVAFQVGFESVSYFTRAFQERFGVFPSHYLK